MSSIRQFLAGCQLVLGDTVKAEQVQLDCPWWCFDVFSIINDFGINHSDLAVIELLSDSVTQ